MKKTTVLRKYRVMCHRVGRRRHHSDFHSLSQIVIFEDVKVGNMESSFGAFDETSMCMSTACVVHRSGGFDASGTMFTQFSICENPSQVL